MPLTALTLVASCSWAHPGADRFTGDPVAAVDSYDSIPAEARAKLKALIARKDYDALVTVTRDSVGEDFGPLYDMHFGRNKLCREVDRSAWKPEHQERALIFCADDYCVALPTVCGNLSRVDRQPKLRAKANNVERIEPTSFEAIASPEPLAAGLPAPIEPANDASFAGPTATRMAAFSYGPSLSVYVPPLPPVPAVPEPATWYLLAAGVGIITLRRRYG